MFFKRKIGKIKFEIQIEYIMKFLNYKLYLEEIRPTSNAQCAL